jgi:hypothetical protein
VSLQGQAEAAKILSWCVGLTEFSAWVLAFCGVGTWYDASEPNPVRQRVRPNVTKASTCHINTSTLH